MCKSYEFMIVVGDPSYHILGVAETRLGPTVDDNLFNIPGYSIIYQDRNTGGGGVAIYVRDTLKVKILSKSEPTSPGKPEVLEYLACQVWQGDGPPVLVFLVYRPPNISFLPPKNILKKLQTKQCPLVKDLRKLCSDYSHKIVMGDCDADLLSKSSEAESLKNLVNKLFFKIVNQGPTNHVGNSHMYRRDFCR